MVKNCNVLIVGLGPTGMVLASILQQYDIDFMIIDKRPAISDITRAVNITPASIAMLKFSLNIDIEKKATKTDNIELFWHNKKKAKINYNKLHLPYKNFYYYQQPYLEKDLLNLLEPSRVFEKTELISIKKDKSSYNVMLKNISTNDTYSVSCNFLIGCDGSSSMVRDWLNIDNDREYYNADFLLFDVETMGNYTSESLYYLYTDGYIIIVPINDKQYRIILSSKDIDHKKLENYKTIDFIKRYLYKKMNTQAPNISKLIWFTSSSFGHRIAHSCNKDTTYICGDAYHTFSPVGGLNLNTGIHDAINLAWKLAYVIHGSAEDTLLKTYHSERNEAILNIKNKTKWMTEHMVRADHHVDLDLSNNKINNYIDIKIPFMLSGYDRYSFTNKSELIGLHISEYFENSEKYSFLCGTIDNRKFNIVAGNKFLQIINNIDTSKVNCHICVFEGDIIDSEKWLLLRPDGYIAYAGDISELNSIEQLINNNLRGY